MYTMLVEIIHISSPRVAPAMVALALLFHASTVIITGQL